MVTTQGPMVTMRQNFDVLPDHRVVVDCRMCGPHIQVTGQGGFATVAEARDFAQNHRRAHVETLQCEILSAVEWKGTS